MEDPHEPAEFGEHLALPDMGNAPVAALDSVAADAGFVDIDLTAATESPNGDDTTQTGEEPEVWFRRHELARQLEAPLSAVKRATTRLQPDFPELFEASSDTRFGKVIRVSSKILDRLVEHLPAPSDWTNIDRLAKELDVKPDTIGRMIPPLRETFEDAFLRRCNRDDILPSEYFSPEVTEAIKVKLDRRRGKERVRQQEKKLEDDFDTFAEELWKGESLEAQEFDKLVSLFGPESALDVLLRYKVEFNHKVLMPRVKSFLADYLGDFIIKPGELELDDINYALPYLDDKNLRQALTEVIKQHCLKTYHQAVRENPDQDDFDIIASYLDDIRDRTIPLENEHIDQVIEDADQYYLSLFEIEVPSKFVDRLQAGRPFPDLNQRINIKEVIDKRKMLIGDAPGMGKSASAILSKEIVGSKCALVITPSVVFDDNVWQGYLTDYFKEGHQPRVLTLGSSDDLIGMNAEDYDYVIVSQEKLDQPVYQDALMGLGFDMLIVDEAHKFKNIVEGSRAPKLIELAEKVSGKDQHLVLLTATPAPNKVEDIALMIRLLYPKRFSQYSNADLVSRIIHGDVLDLRGMLLPRMQIKRLEDCVDIAPLVHEFIDLELPEANKEIYELLLDEWELEAKDKLRYLRQMLLNPAVLDATPEIGSAKAEAVGRGLRESFKTKDKVVMFINDYINGVVTGPRNIVQDLNISHDVETYLIYGDIPKKERQTIMKHFQEATGKKVLLLVSGQTVSVGVDLSAADEVVFYNEPWTETEKRQQIGRSHRPGRNGPLNVKTYIVRGSIEEGIHKYIAAKYRAIEKLLYGIPLTDIERELIQVSEKGTADEALNVNAELAEYYFSARDRMNKIFSRVKEIGTPEMLKFLQRYGTEYANTYQDLTSRSYQANASRLSGTLIKRFADDKQSQQPPRILDVGSGPEMLKRHITDDLAEQVTSIDINPKHFQTGSGQRATGSMVQLPVASKSYDYVNVSLAWHYTKWLPSKGNHERLASLQEFNRVLKPGGRAVITLIHSMDIRDDVAFHAVVNKLGFAVVPEYSGNVQSSDSFKARVITLEKVADCPATLSETIAHVGASANSALRFVDRTSSLRDTSRIASSFTIQKQGAIQTAFSSADSIVVTEERALVSEMTALRNHYGKIEQIEETEIIKRGMARFFNGKSYVLFKRMTSARGAVVLRNFS